MAIYCRVSSQHATTLVPVYCIVLQFHIDYLPHASLHLPAMLSKSQKKKNPANLKIEKRKLCCFVVSCIKKFVVLQLIQVRDVGESSSATTKRVFKPALVCSCITSSDKNMKINAGGELCVMMDYQARASFKPLQKYFHTEISRNW